MEKEEIFKIERSGITVVEVMVVVAIVGILVASSFFILRSMGSHLRLSGVALEFKQSCSLARQLALEKNRTYMIRCFPDSTPQLWWITRVDSVGYFTNIQRDTLHPSIRFGVGDDVTGSGSITTGPDGNPLPDDGVSFPANALAFMPRRGAPVTGAVYFTNGRETRAVLVNVFGSAQVMQYAGSGNWK